MLSGACHTSEGRLGNRGEVRRVVLMGCTIGVFDMNSGRLDAEARRVRGRRGRPDALHGPRDGVRMHQTQAKV